MNKKWSDDDDDESLPDIPISWTNHIIIFPLFIINANIDTINTYPISINHKILYNLRGG